MRVRKPKPQVTVDPDAFARDVAALVERASIGIALLAGRVEDVDRQLTQQPLSAAVGLYDDFRNAVEKLKEAQKVLAEKLDEWNRVKLPEMFQRESVRTINIEGRGRFTRTHKVSASVKDWDVANGWLRAIGQGDAIREMVPSQTMSSLVGEALKEGKAAPTPAIETRIIWVISREKA